MEPMNMKLLSEISGVDVCLSGHTHNRIYKPVLQGKILIIRSGCHGSFLTRLDLEINEDTIINYKHQLIEVAETIPEDKKTKNMVQEALNPYRKELSQIVGRTAIGLDRGKNLEYTMDNFLLSTLLYNAKTQIAFSNGWRYGAPVFPCDITLNDLYNMLPMNPPISTVELSGMEIANMLEENIEHTFAPDPYNQMGGYIKRCLGLTACLKLENPYGYCIQKLFIGNEEVKYNENYTASLVTEQGVPKKYGRFREDTSINAIVGLISYLSSRKVIQEGLRGTFDLA